jgi:hypothetical protein
MAGLFHGGKPLCERLKASTQPINEKSESFFNETLIFDIQVCNIPRNAKLCFCIYEVPKSSKLVRAKKGKEYGNNKVNVPFSLRITSSIIIICRTGVVYSYSVGKYDCL